MLNIIVFLKSGIAQKMGIGKELYVSTLKKTGKKEGEKECRQQLIVLQAAKNVIKKLRQLMCIKSFVALFAERRQTLENQRKSINVRIAERNSLQQDIIKETHVLKNVQVSSRFLKEKERVYDLTIEDEHEFFANGVLVHNCDPTVIEAIYYYNGGYIIDEIVYKKGLSNKQIADILIAQENNVLVTADSAEPKSIDEIRSYGVNIIGVKKGADSVRQGIQFVQDQKISVTKRSVKTIECYRNYMWETDKDGKILNKPDHAFSDPMDAIRYGMSGLNREKKDNQGVKAADAYYKSMNYKTKGASNAKRFYS